MTPVVSWWLLALVVGGASPLWVRALVNRWEHRAKQRTERVLLEFEADAMSDSTEETDTDES